jgi:hypothetical protein
MDVEKQEHVILLNIVAQNYVEILKDYLVRLAIKGILLMNALVHI